MRYPEIPAAIMLIAVFLLSGCESEGIKTYPVRGTVVFADGSPVKSGRIEFYHSQHDLTSRGTIQADGVFLLGTYSKEDGAPAGAHDVAIAQLIMSGEAGVTSHDHGKHIDSQYADYKTSGIQLTVQTSEDNEFRIVVDAARAKVRGR